MSIVNKIFTSRENDDNHVIVIRDEEPKVFFRIVHFNPSSLNIEMGSAELSKDKGEFLAEKRSTGITYDLSQREALG